MRGFDRREQSLEWRRSMRRRLIEAGEGQLVGGLLALAVSGGLAVHSATIPDAVGVALLGSVILLLAALARARKDECPSCRAEVDALADLHCWRCGGLLDEVPQRPPGFDEALEELEAELEARDESEPVEVADGVEVVAP